MRARGTIEFVDDDDGTVHVEVLTREVAADFCAWGQSYSLAEQVEATGGFGLVTTGVPPERAGEEGLPAGWRYLRVRAKVEAGPLAKDIKRKLDLSEGSDDRRIVAQLVRQGAMRGVWVNERAESVCEFTDTQRPAWAEALVNTEGVTREAWREELAEQEWRDSPSWRPGLSRPRRYKRRTVAAPAQPVAWFARRSGAIPRAGTPTVAGVKLPRGSRLPSPGAAYWATDEVADDAV